MNRLLILPFIVLLSCNTSENTVENFPLPRTVSILSLGDSYTKGQGVCATCNFPIQLKDSLQNLVEENTTISLQTIAETGWTTSQLLQSVTTQNPPPYQDLVTLLIGVNNQYQNKPFSLFETEFPELISIATSLARGDKNKIIVISIPDYAFTPFGNGNASISNQLQIYNQYIASYCELNEISFVNITDITQNGLENPILVASDGLHPSKEAYSLFVKRLLPIAKEKLNL